MGLDTTHGCWHGSCRSFNEWRVEIARAAGLPPLDLMEGYYNNDDEIGPFAKAKILLKDKGGIGPQMQQVLDLLPIKWDCLKQSPLFVLLNHSDCDGLIDWCLCAPLANALEAILPNISDDSGHPSIPSHKKNTETFIAGLRKATALKQNVEFH